MKLPGRRRTAERKLVFRQTCPKNNFRPPVWKTPPAVRRGVICNVLSDRKFVDWRFCEGDPDSIPDPFLEQRSDPHAGLDAPGLAAAGLGHAEMQREHDAPLLHPPHQFAVSLRHHDGIAGFQRDDDVQEIRFDAHLQPLHGRHGHGVRGVAVALGDIAAERTVVESHADGGAVLLADGEESGELRARLFVVGMEVARIDADLFHDGRHGYGRLGREMDVRDQRNRAACRPQAALDLRQVRDVLQARDRDAHQLRAGSGELQRLGHRGLDVGSVRIAHRLDGDGMPAADDQFIADPDGKGINSGHRRCIWLPAAAAPSSCRSVWSAGNARPPWR